MRSRLTALATVLALSVTGCSGGDEDPTAGPTGSPTGATPSEPSSSGTEEPQETKPVDPCGLVGRSDWAPLVEREARATVVPTRQISSIVPGVYECRIAGRVSDYARLSFGYSLGPVDWEALRRRTKPGVIGDRVELSGIGDEAFVATGLAGVDAYARIGDQVVVVTAYDAVSSSDLVALLATLALETDPAWHAHPVVLPEACPAADDEAVTGLLGPVSYARGDVYRVPRVKGRQASCHYVNERGELAAVDVSEHLADYPDVEDFILESTLGRVVDDVPGRVRTVAQDKADKSWSSQTGLPEPRLWTIISTSANHLTEEPFEGTRAAYLRFADRVDAAMVRAFRR